MGAQGWGVGRMESFCSIVEFQFYMKRAMVMDGGDNYTTLCICLISLNYTLKMVKMIISVLRVFRQD